MIKELFKTPGIPLEQTDIQIFEKFGLDETGEYVEYEKYVAKVVEKNERRLQMMIQES